MEKLKSLEKEMMKTVEKADKVKALLFFFSQLVVILINGKNDTAKWSKLSHYISIYTFALLYLGTHLPTVPFQFFRILLRPIHQ